MKRKESSAVIDQPNFDGLVHEQTAAAVVQRAYEDVEAACSFLHVVGYFDHRSTISLNLMLRLAAMMRLHQWQQSEISDRLPDLPRAEAVLKEIRSARRNNPGGSLSNENLVAQVHGAWFFNMAHVPLAPFADILIDDCNGEALFDELAEFLWQHRDVNSSIGKEEE